MYVGIPIGTKREWLFVLMGCLVLLGIPLLLRVRHRRKGPPIEMGRAANFAGIVVLLEFALCLIQVASLSLLIYHHPDLANRLP
jgi:hypothetical protein